MNDDKKNNSERQENNIINDILSQLPLIGNMYNITEKSVLIRLAINNQQFDILPDDLKREIIEKTKDIITKGYATKEYDCLEYRIRFKSPNILEMNKINALRNQYQNDPNKADKADLLLLVLYTDYITINQEVINVFDDQESKLLLEPPIIEYDSDGRKTDKTIENLVKFYSNLSYITFSIVWQNLTEFIDILNVGKVFIDKIINFLKQIRNTSLKG